MLFLKIRGEKRKQKYRRKKKRKRVNHRLLQMTNKRRFDKKK
jgi:hypothetical protein